MTKMTSQKTTSRFLKIILFGLLTNLICLSIQSQEISKDLINNGLTINVPNDIKLTLPKTSYSQRTPYEEVTFNLYLLNSEDATILYADGKIIDINDIKNQLESWRESVYERNKPRMTIRLIVDSSTPMNMLNTVKKELANNYALRVAYAVYPLDSLNDIKNVLENTIISELRPPNSSQSYVAMIKDNENSITIKHTEDASELLYNGKIIKANELENHMKKDITENPNPIIKYYLNDNLDFESYISIISQNHLIIKELREAYSVVNYSLKYENLDAESSKIVNRQFRLRLIEVENELAKLAEE